ncbi:prominin-1-A isoform X2 [Sitodiplosis mosellana]|uniref:prominin-1-A isoform X2 n=1 Tax=Sitodiplosis mosellana TaxID=263140 RepID=UPI002443AB77|nr:prominin-1-A isoform X2 [Sitodiplosis mosellana]
MIENAVTQDTFVEYDDHRDEPETYFIVPATIGPEDGRHLFRYLGVFLTYITPRDLTVVNCILELLKHVFETRVTVVNLVWEALKVESGFIGLMVIFLLIAFIPIFTLMIWCCTSDKPDDTMYMHSSGVDGEIQTNPIISFDDSNIDSTLYCRRILQFLLQFFTLFLIASITVMFITNELIRSTISNTPTIVKSSLLDVETFSKDAHKEIISTIHEGLSTASERIKYDLENVDKLLGDPIQKKIEADSGLKTTLESILTICSGNFELIHRVQLLQDALGKAILISKEATSRIEEFQVQLSILQRQCSSRDRPLCDTLRLRSFEDNGLLNILTRMQSDPNLLRMMNLGEYHVNSKHINISTEMRAVQDRMMDFPSVIKMDMKKNVESIEKVLLDIQDSIRSATQDLSNMMNGMVKKVNEQHENVRPLMEKLQNASDLLWIVSLATTLAVLCISLLLSISLLLGIIHAETSAKITFILSAVLIAIGSFGLAAFTILVLLAGSHGEVFLCRPLYDTPNYQVFSKLFDRPGWVYENETVNGIVNDFLSTPDVNESRMLNISLANAIERCQQNDAVFAVFQFDRIVNISQIFDAQEHSRLEDEIEKIFVSASSFLTLTEDLQNILNYMFTNSDINFLAYRTDLSRPTPEKDLSTFIDQMQRVSVQIQESTTSSRMSTLGNRARRLQSNILQPLERLRSEIQFELTALQLQKEPWTDMVNQSLTHLKTTQFFINQDSAEICSNKTTAFKLRLKEHLMLNKRETLRQLMNNIAPCRPLFNIFDANRHLFCHHIIDPMNGLWFSGFVSLSLWAILTPIALGLATIYKKMEYSRGITRSSSHQAPADSLIISEQSNWGSSKQMSSSNVNRPSNW